MAEVGRDPLGGRMVVEGIWVVSPGDPVVIDLLRGLVPFREVARDEVVYLPMVCEDALSGEAERFEGKEV